MESMNEERYFHTLKTHAMYVIVHVDILPRYELQNHELLKDQMLEFMFNCY